MAEVDINDIFKRSDIRASPEEHTDERVARLRNERLAEVISQAKDVAIFVVVLLGIVGAGVLLVYLVVFSKTVSAETQRWAETALSALVSGGASFLLGQKSARKIEKRSLAD